MHPATYTPAVEHIVDTRHLILAQRDSGRLHQNGQTLARAGFIVKQTASAEAAATEAMAWPAGVIVTDLSLPDMGGFELCRRLRESPRTAEAFILGVTDWTGRDDYTRAMQAGFDLLISSQFDARAFAAEVVRVRLQGASLRRKASLIRRRAAEAILDAAAALERSKLAREQRSRCFINRDDAMKRIRSDFFELPGLKLTVSQGSRLWGVATEMCGTLLDELTSRGFLTRCGDQYERR